MMSNLNIPADSEAAAAAVSASEEALNRAVPGCGDARLKVTFASRAWRWLPFVWTDLWVLTVSPDDSCALVGTPDRRGLWLLSRRPVLGDADLEWLIGHANRQGYDTMALLLTGQRS